MTLILTGTTEGYQTDTLLPVRATLKDNSFVLWDYDYRNEKVIHKAPIKELEWSHWRKRDTSGQWYTYYRAFTGHNGYYYQEFKLSEINFQTWDHKSVWIGCQYPGKRDIWVNVCVRVTLDEKSILRFAEFVSNLTKE